MKNLFFILSLCFICNIYSQNNNEIYRVEHRAESPGIATYDVNVLTLNADGTYEIMYQQYATKKMMKKNIILNLERQVGNWKKEENNFILTNTEDGQSMRFHIKKKSKIALMMKNSEVSTLDWCKVN